jgi:preprotein translocase subunit SecF
VKSVSFNPFYYKWDFAKRRNLYFIISGLLLVIGLLSLLLRGLNLGVDFSSGTRVDVLIGDKFSDKDVRKVSEDVGLKPESIRSAGEGTSTTAVIRYKGTITKEQFEALTKAFQAKYGNKVSLNESSISSQVGRELAQKAIYSVLIASIGIIIYITIRFEYRFAISAVVALLHDVLMIIGVFALFQFEVDTTFIVALLTIVGYSINDTIVTFDRIRENMKRMKIKTIQDLEDLVNISIRQTLVRSINTVLTVIFASVALLVFGGEGIRIFSLALTVGLFFGVYSSIFIASQMWLVWKSNELKKKRLKPEVQS